MVWRTCPALLVVLIVSSGSAPLSPSLSGFVLTSPEQTLWTSPGSGSPTASSADRTAVHAVTVTRSAHREKLAPSFDRGSPALATPSRSCTDRPFGAIPFICSLSIVPLRL